MTEREVIEHKDSVAIVPIDANHNVLLIKEHRAGSNSYIYTLPGGQLDYNELPESAAMRVLLEASGYRASRLFKLGYVYFHSAVSTRKLYVFLGYDLSSEPLHHENMKCIEIHRMPLEGAIQLVHHDFVSDMSTIGNLLMARDKLRELNL